LTGYPEIIPSQKSVESAEQVAGTILHTLLAVAKYLVLINGILGLFNLVPGFPLDGARPGAKSLRLTFLELRTVIPGRPLVTTSLRIEPVPSDASCATQREAVSNTQSTIRVVVRIADALLRLHKSARGECPAKPVDAATY